MSVLQICPNHADHISYYNDKYLNEMFARGNVIAQPKYDGERMLIHIDGENIYCTSRRISTKTKQYMENQDKVPVLHEIFKDVKKMAYTVLDCECYAKDWSTSASILHSLPEKAIELQKQDVLKFACFDCLFFNGTDIRERPYIERLECLLSVLHNVESLDCHPVKFMNNSSSPGGASLLVPVQNKQHAEQMMQTALDNGFEGIVLKSLHKTYYEKGASLKCKKFETVDVVVIDVQQGRGKYADTIGALRVGYFDGGDEEDFTIISNVNCSTDEERNWWRDNWPQARYSVIEVKCQEVTDKSLRHPVYLRRRDDKSFTDCTKDTIFK